MSRGATLRIAIAFTLAVAAIAAAYLLAPRPATRTGVVDGAASIGGPFSLVDHRGATVTDEDFRGAFMLVYFGYTACPDVCAPDLQFMASALDRLGDAGEKVRPVFITVDPARDTPAVLAAYVARFHPRLVGLTGTAAEIAAVASAYGVFHEPDATATAEDGGIAPDYLVSHTAVMILLGPDGGFLRVFSHGAGRGPYTSLVLVAVDAGGAPVLLLSDLAEHSRNIAGDDRVALLIDGTQGLEDRLTGPRLTLLGRAARSADPDHRARYLARHPSAERYADFGDFAFYRVTVDSAHLVAGFGKIHTIAGAELLGGA